MEDPHKLEQLLLNREAKKQQRQASGTEQRKPYKSRLQGLVDAVAGPYNTILLDHATDRLLRPDNSKHPKDTRKGSVESVVKYLGSNFGTLFGPDYPYLEQYFHPDANVMEPAT